jgi:hypothetical protein
MFHLAAPALQCDSAQDLRNSQSQINVTGLAAMSYPVMTKFRILAGISVSLPKYKKINIVRQEK